MVIEIVFEILHVIFCQTGISRNTAVTWWSVGGRLLPVAHLTLRHHLVPLLVSQTVASTSH